MILNGAGEQTRTADLLITNQLLYQLSYAGPGGMGTHGLRRPESLGALTSVATRPQLKNRSTSSTLRDVSGGPAWFARRPLI